MSDWELVDNKAPSPAKNTQPSSDWEMAPTEPVSRQQQPQETLGMAALKALPRIGEDVIRGGYNFIKNIPQYADAAKTEVPGAVNALMNHPGHALGQVGAGLAELGQNVFNTPHDIVNYATNRLNLVPQEWNQKVQMARMPDDTEGMINDTFGKPQYEGEALLRGTARNALNLLGAGAAAKTLNPLNLTARNIAKDVVQTGAKNKEIYSNLYNNLWKEAEKKGFGDALYDVNIDLPTLKKYSPKKSIAGVMDFVQNPTLQTAHAAKSDLLRIQRDLGKMTTLKTAERKQLKAVTDGIDSIQSNMFKDKAGNIDAGMLDKYNKIQQGFANDVIPYRNKAINKFKRNEISPRELINSLSQGEFMAKKGSAHPALGIRNKLKPTLQGVGGAAILKYLYDQAMGNGSTEQ